MRLVHRQNGTERDLATRVETADTFLSRARGLMFRRSISEEYALVFRFDDASRRNLHMVFVPFPIDALWLRGRRVERSKRLSAWTGLGWGVADTIVELPAGAADGVEVGDVVELVE
ncbi:MAG: DUF192 domain-containing protein [Salinigranum sp.]